MGVKGCGKTQLNIWDARLNRIKDCYKTVEGMGRHAQQGQMLLLNTAEVWDARLHRVKGCGKTQLNILGR